MAGRFWLYTSTHPAFTLGAPYYREVIPNKQPWRYWNSLDNMWQNTQPPNNFYILVSTLYLRLKGLPEDAWTPR